MLSGNLKRNTALIDKVFEDWFNENFPHVSDPITRSIARCAWDARWELVIEEFREAHREKQK